MGMHTAAVVWAWLGENVASVVASVIAICTAGFTLYQARILRHHNYVSTRPDFTAHTDRNDQPLDLGGERRQVQFTALLVNVGLGPAIITSARLTFDGNDVVVKDRNAVQAAVRSALNHPLQGLTVFTVAGRYGVPSNSSVRLLGLTFMAASDVEAEGVLSRLERLHLVVNYRSVYGETFTYDSKGP